jgi:hypothetical protein
VGKRNPPMDLIERIAANWQRLRPKLQGLPMILDQDNIFICPLCYQVFPREQWSGLTLEHVPPKAVGGKGITITCKPCNNNMGANIDSHLAREQNFMDFLEGVPGASWDGTYSVNDLPHRLWASFARGNKGEWIILGNPKYTDPAQLQDAMNAFENVQWQDFRWHLQMKGPNPRRAQIALLRAAYLWGFACLGYPFLFNRHIELVRQQIVNPSQELLPNLPVLKGEFTEDQIGVSLIREPLEMRSYLIVVPLRSKSNVIRRKGVILPAPIQDGLRIYEHSEDQRGFSRTMQLTRITKDYDMNYAPFDYLRIWDSTE